MIFRNSGSFKKRLANQYLSQYRDLNGPQVFNQYLNKKKYQIEVKNRLILGVWLKIKIFPVQLANQNILQY